MPPALPVEALAGFYSAIIDFGDASVADALRSAATSRLARYALEAQVRVRAFAQPVLGPRYSRSWRLLTYLNRALRSRTGEDSLDTLRASREVRAREGVMWVAEHE